MMSDTTVQAPSQGWLSRLWRSAPVRIIVGALVTILPVALPMAAIHALIAKPYRQVWPFLLASLFCLLAYRWFTQTVEKRSPTELARQGALRELGLGLLMGLGLICAVTLALRAVGLVHFEVGDATNWPRLFGEMTLAAAMEEVVFRGVLFRILANWLGARAAIVISALLFGVAHLNGDGFTVTAFIGLVLASVMLTAAYMRRGRLWLPIGLHFGWNFTCTALFGYTTSGHAAQGYLHTTLTGPDWLSGGAFGVEASVVTLLATVIVSVILLVRPSIPLVPRINKESHA
ncbi:MAG: CPBP family intramembrane metalloprotease [Burkholderiales bacterium]|nr:CPBP family intramembrane metalloprotease [Burkholderiales bacterium]